LTLRLKDLFIELLDIIDHPVFPRLIMSTFITVCFQHLCSTHHTVVIMGDFNMPLVDWDLYGGPDTPMYSAFLHFINNYGLHQYVNRPTRGDKILDVVLSSSDSLVNDMQVTPLLA